MATKIFKNNDELKALIEKSINGDEYINFKGYNVICEFDIDLKGVSLINAKDIKAKDINASDIKAGDISALTIKANHIDYYAVCFAYKNITCKSIEGRRENSKHFCLDGEITINK